MDTSELKALRLPWLDQFEVGVPELDEDHRLLHVLVNRACQACAGGNRMEILLIMRDLRRRALQHFEREQEFCRRLAIPNKERPFVQRAEPLRRIEHRILTEDGDAILSQAPTFLVDWYCRSTIGCDAPVRARFHSGEVALRRPA